MLTANHISQQHFLPATDLEPFVASYCQYEFGTNLRQQELFFLPEGIVEVVVQFGLSSKYKQLDASQWSQRSTGFVGGLHTQSYQLQVLDSGKAFSIRFRAGTFSNFSSVPVHKIKNSLICPTLIWGASAEAWIDQIAAATDAQAKVRLTNIFLRKQCRPARCPLPVGHLMQYINNHNGHCMVSELAKEACLSPAQFRANFNACFGVAPKEYLQLYRLGKARQLARQFPRLTDLAYQLGYYDQAHFNKDIRQLTGLSPGQLFHIYQG